MVSRTNAVAAEEQARAMRVGLIKAFGLSTSNLAQRMTTMKKGAMYAWRMTSHRHQSFGLGSFCSDTAGSCSGDCIIVLSVGDKMA